MLELSDKDFVKIRDIMYAHSGVYLKETKKQLVISRLRKRLLELKLDSFEDYIELIEKLGSQELSIFINAITTNETYFFRHSKQFNILYKNILPELAERKKERDRQIVIWSAACATGEEPYSAAIVCCEFFKLNPGARWKVYASDINNEVLEHARCGVYSARSLRETPETIRNRYFRQVGRDKDKAFEIEGIIKDHVEFLPHNLLLPFQHRGIDIVFLRNAMIYFDDTARYKVVSLVSNTLVDGGYLFVSPSETLNDMQSDFVLWDSAIYRKKY